MNSPKWSLDQIFFLVKFSRIHFPAKEMNPNCNNIAKHVDKTLETSNTTKLEIRLFGSFGI